MFFKNSKPGTNFSKSKAGVVVILKDWLNELIWLLGTGTKRCSTHSRLAIGGTIAERNNPILHLKQQSEEPYLTQPVLNSIGAFLVLQLSVGLDQRLGGLKLNENCS